MCSPAVLGHPAIHWAHAPIHSWLNQTLFFPLPFFIIPDAILSLFDQPSVSGIFLSRWRGERGRSWPKNIFILSGAKQRHGGENLPDSFTLEQRQSNNLHGTSASPSTTFSILPRRCGIDWASFRCTFTHTHTRLSMDIQILNSHLTPVYWARKSSEWIVGSFRINHVFALHIINSPHLWPPPACWQQHSKRATTTLWSLTQAKKQHTMGQNHKESVIYWCNWKKKNKKKTFSSAGIRTPRNTAPDELGMQFKVLYCQNDVLFFIL